MKYVVRILLVFVFILMILGALLVFSASTTYSEVKFNNTYFLFNSHIWKVIGAIAALIIVSLIPYDYYKKFDKHFLLGIILILIVTFLLSSKLKGATRWINIGIIQFQPSEMAKLILIIHLANFIEKKGELLKDFKKGYRYSLVSIFLISGLVYIQPNVSTSIVIILTSLILLYIGGSKIKYLLITLSTILIIGTGFVMMFSHSRLRLLSYINSFLHGGEPNIQVLQAKIGLGSGGLLGVGLGQSRQSDLFLPEAHGDFIFSVLGEEFGFIGTITVLIIYLIIFFLGVIIAKKAKDNFGQILGFGISINIIVTAFIHTFVVLGLLPTTGITLPFISFGGTSIIIFSVSVGILVNIAKESLTYRRLLAENV
ncbi:FtsW/RodA/SpoVE family cell cycle protein [Bacteroidota bacterium]